MANASFQQTDFSGGQWSSSAAGLITDPRYKTALDVCQNALPKVSKQWTRRPGLTFMAHTRNGSPGKLLAFHYNAIEPYQIELTDARLRLYASLGLLLTSDTPVLVSISGANPAVVTLAALPAGWAAGDTVMFHFNSPPWTAAAALAGRQFIIQNISGATFELWDSLTGASIDGSTFTYTAPTFGAPDNVLKVVEFVTPYNNGSWANTRLVQDSTTAYLLNNANQPRALTQAFGTFGLNAAVFQDGPYLDINTTTTTLTPSGTTGSITLTASAATGINNGQGFVETDIGRLVRFQSGPAAWAGGTTYATGATVTGSDANVYTSLVGGNIGHDPTTDTGTFWTLAGTTITWTWLQITAWTSSTVVTATVMGVNLPSTAAQTAWRLGAFSDTTGWPSCGTFHEGRFWFGGVFDNRLDASAVGAGVGTLGGVLNFSPTASDGTVGDANAISATLNAPNVNKILWFIPNNEGIVVGTAEAEWLISASAQNDPLTPSTIQAHRVSKYGSIPNDAIECELTMCFVQAQGRRILNYAHYPYGEAAGWYAENLLELAEDLPDGGITEIRFVQTPTPVIWARTIMGNLIGSTFEHPAYGKEPKNGWHQHFHGAGYTFISLCSGPTFNGQSQTLYVITQDPTTGYCYVEAMAEIFEESQAGWEAVFTDGIVPVTQADVKLIANGDTYNGVRLYGQADAVGKVVTPVINGYDLGQLTVQSPGYVDIPFDSVFTQASLASISNALAYGPYTLPTAQKFGSYAGIGLIRYPVRTSVVAGWTLGAWRMTIEDYARNYMYLISSLGVSRCNLATGDLIDQFSFASLFKGLTGLTLTSAMAYDRVTGLMYCQLSANTAHRVIYQIDPVNKKIVGQFGTDDNVGASSTVASLLVNSVSINIGNYKLSRTAQGSIYSQTALNSAEVAFMDCTRMQFVGLYAGITQSRASVIFGNQNSNLLTFYAMGHGQQGVDSVANIQLYKVQLTLAQAIIGVSPSTSTASWQVSGATIGAAITVANIDATWTHFNKVLGPMLDPTDGHLVFSITTNDAVTNKRYWVKINSTTGAIVWKVAGGAYLPLGMEAMMHLQRLPASLYTYFDSPTTIKTLNLVAGTLGAVTYNLGTGTLTGGSLGNFTPELGLLVDDRGYTEGTILPNYLGDSTYFGGSFTNTVAGAVLNAPTPCEGATFLLGYSNAPTGSRTNWTYDHVRQLLYVNYTAPSQIAVNDGNLGTINKIVTFSSIFAGTTAAAQDLQGRGPWFDTAGYLYFNTSPTNSAILYKVDPSTMKVIGQFGTDSSSFGNNIASIEAIDTASAVQQSGLNYLACHCALSQDVVLMQVAGSPSFVATWSSASLGGVTRVAQGAAGTFFISGRTGTVVKLSKVVISGAVATITTLGTFDVTTLDVAITGFAELAMYYDPSDGNVVFFEAPTAGIGTYWWFKLSATNAALVWSLQETVETNSPLQNQEWDTQITKNGRLVWMSTSSHFRVLDTTLGTKTTLNYATSLVQFAAAVDEGSDPGNLAVIGQISWGYSAGTKPDYINTAADSFAGLAKFGFRGSEAINCHWPPPGNYYLPCSLGVRFTSLGKLLPPDFGQDAGAQSGPAFGKLRRVHWYSLKLVQSGPLTIAADDQTQRNADLQTPGGVATTVPNLFTGTVSTTIECDDSFNGQLTWQASLAYPVTVATIGGYLQSSDK